MDFTIFHIYNPGFVLNKSRQEINKKKKEASNLINKSDRLGHHILFLSDYNLRFIRLCVTKPHRIKKKEEREK